MPKIYRAMKSDSDGLPLLSRSANGLGVRPDVDIPIAENGSVQPLTGGMSVAPSLKTLPPNLLPKRLRPIVPQASAPDSQTVWSFGEGDFKDGQLAEHLSLRVDRPDRHGLVEPLEPMIYTVDELSIQSTRSQWVIDEEKR